MSCMVAGAESWKPGEPLGEPLGAPQACGKDRGVEEMSYFMCQLGDAMQLNEGESDSD